MSRKELKKQQIIQAATEVFSGSNYQGVTIREIAQKAGIAEGTIHLYFKGKEDLFLSIPLEKMGVFYQQIDLHLQGVTGALGKIKKLLWYYLYFFKTNPGYARSLMLEIPVSRGFIKSRACKEMRKFSSQVLEILKEGQEEGVIRKDTDIYLSRQLLLGMLEHMVKRWLLKGEKYDLLQCHDQVSELVLTGIGYQVGSGVPFQGRWHQHGGAAIQQ